MPYEQVMVNDADAVYPLTQTGVHDDPLGVEGEQEDENVVEDVSEGMEHGFGVHTAVGGVHTPLDWHVAEKDPEERYDVDPQAIIHDPPEG